MDDDQQVALLVEMCRFEKIEKECPKIFKAFLILLVDIFEQSVRRKSVSRPPKTPFVPRGKEWLEKLAQPFMIGLRCRDPKIRARYTKLYHSKIGSVS